MHSQCADSWRTRRCDGWVTLLVADCRMLCPANPVYPVGQALPSAGAGRRMYERGRCSAVCQRPGDRQGHRPPCELRLARPDTGRRSLALRRRDAFHIARPDTRSAHLPCRRRLRYRQFAFRRGADHPDRSRGLPAFQGAQPWSCRSPPAYPHRRAILHRRHNARHPRGDICQLDAECRP